MAMILFRNFCGLLMIVFGFLAEDGLGQSPTLAFTDGKVVVENLDAEVLFTFCRFNNSHDDWVSVFPVSTSESPEGVTIDGRYEVMETSVTFTPRFEFAPGVRYRASFFTRELTDNTNDIYLPAQSAD